MMMMTSVFLRFLRINPRLPPTSKVQYIMSFMAEMRNLYIKSFWLFLFIFASNALRFSYPLISVQNSQGKLIYTGRRTKSQTLKEVAFCSCNEQMIQRRSSPTNFDLLSSIILAGYAFDSYNEAEFGKPTIGLDNTKTVYRSCDHIRQSFSGVLLISFKRLLLQNNVQETSLFEKIVTGESPDPYIVAAVYESYAPLSPWKTKVVDSIRSTTKKNSRIATWEKDGHGKQQEESYALYVREFDTAVIEFSVFNEELFGPDKFIGNTLVNFPELRQHMVENSSCIGEEVYELLLPIYFGGANTGEKSFPKRSGTLSVQARYLPWKYLSDRQVNKLIELSEEEMGGSWVQILRPDPHISNCSLSAHEVEGKSSPSRYTSHSDNSLGRFLPKGTTNWTGLLGDIIGFYKNPSSFLLPQLENPPYADVSSLALLESLSSKELVHICSIDSLMTDTQVGVWADLNRKRVVIAFRGTETVKIKDIITDINLIQVPFRSEHSSLSPLLVHRGFLNGYNSVQIAILQEISQLFNSNFGSQNNSWEIYITGHSLGGALSHLLAFDLARIQRGLFNATASSSVALGGKVASLSSRAHREVSSRRFSNDQQDPPRHVAFESNLVEAEGDGALLFALDEDNPMNRRFMSELSHAKVSVYSFGAPRVGNKAFRDTFNEFVPNCFRVVNQKDIVARLPRSSKANVLEFEHVGRTVLLDVTRGDGDEVWVQREVSDQCPLDDFDLFSAATQPISNSSALSLFNTTDWISSVPKGINLTSISLSLDDVLRGSPWETFSNSLESMGMSGRFIAKEKQLLSSILDFTAVNHHLEPSYFESFLKLASKKIFDMQAIGDESIDQQ